MVAPLQAYNQVRLNAMIAGAARQLLMAFGEYETVVGVLGGLVTDASMKAGKLTRGMIPNPMASFPLGQPATEEGPEPITEEDFEWYKVTIDQMQAIVDDLRGKDREGALTLIRMLSRLDQ